MITILNVQVKILYLLHPALNISHVCSVLHKSVTNNSFTYVIQNHIDK
jgi:hypothetical protein